MNIEEFRAYCLQKKGVTEGFPFDEDTLVFKVMGKMFALTSLNGIPLKTNLKCYPERAMELRQEFEEIIAGFHMNKKHWNTVQLQESNLPRELVFDLIDHSYELVVKGLSKKMKEELANY